MRIAFVCQRYGEEVNGGSELLCRQLAEHLACKNDVEVYTTCAVDYVTWKNEYPAGTTDINKVTVHRFPARKERNEITFKVISKVIFRLPRHTKFLEKVWLNEQGPLCPELIKQLFHDQTSFDAIFFMTYLYYLTAKGLPMGFKNAYLIPTVHDEPPVYLRVYNKVFKSAKGFLWMTKTEKILPRNAFLLS